MIQLTRQGVNFTGVEGDLNTLRCEFDRRNCLLLENFLHPDVISLLLPMIRTATFRPKHHDDDVGSELQMEPSMALNLLSFLTNDLKLFELVDKITSCGPVGCFQGRVYKLISDGAHFLDWHNDLTPGRLIAMSLNLSTASFRGGALQIREVRGGRIVSEVANTGFGNAVIFRISPYLEHRVTQIQGAAPRISFAGWFWSYPDIRTRWGQLRGEIAEGGRG